ncbi:MAG: FAD-binding oxidoreductase [Burkholderiales bacterium]|nr:FAD-binding oxidoreductase [Burkholderiales bacterium]
MLMAVDVAIVGGGVIGCSVAHYLSATGARVAVVERTQIGRGASAANSGVISLATKKPGLALDLALVSQQMFPTLSAELGYDVEYLVDGGMIIAQSETQARFLDELVAAQRSDGAGIAMIDAAQAIALNPLLAGRVLSASHCPTDAQANPFRVTQGFARSAEKLGAAILHDTAVEAIDVSGGRVRSVHTSRGEIRTRWIVNAAGAHANEVGKMVGVEHDVVPRRGQLVILEATDDLPNIRVSSAGALLAKHQGSTQSINAAFAYTRKPLSGTVMLGGTNEFAGFDTATTKTGIGEICRLAVSAMPYLGQLHALRSWAGLRPYSPQGPQLGLTQGPAGYAVAIGHGGDGVALAPVTGRYVAEVIAADGKDADLKQYLAREKARLAANAGQRGVTA